MRLSKIKIQNYRSLIDAELEVDAKTTLIVGRNNTGKTSCFECISNVLNGDSFSFNDYPLQKRENLYVKIASFMEKQLTFEELAKIPLSATAIYFMYVAQGQRKGWFSL